MGGTEAVAAAQRGVSFSEWHMDIEGCLSLRRACGPSVCQWSRCSPLPLPLSLPLPPPRPLPLPLEQWLALHSMIGRRDPLSQRVRLVCSAVRRGGSLLLSLALLLPALLPRCPPWSASQAQHANFNFFCAESRARHRWFPANFPIAAVTACLRVGEKQQK